jgi:tetratricopeptide (TPR) repeat protein
MKLRVRLFAALALLVAAAPANATWKEARSRHFTVYSEGSEASLAEVARKLEKFEFMLRAVSDTRDKGSTAPLKVYLMSSRRAVQATMGIGSGDGVAGYYSASSRGPIAIGTRPDVDRATRGYTRVGAAPSFDITSESVLLHEYTHHFMFQHFPAAYPAWYSEGFAEYYGSTRFREHDVIEIGHVASHRYATLQFDNWLPIDRLLTAKDYSDVGENIDQLYAEGWLLVHYLGNARERRGQLGRYLELLNRGVPYPDAMKQAFGSDIGRLDSELQAYADKGRLTAVSLPFKPIDVGPITTRTLSPAEDALIDIDIALGRGLYASEAQPFVESVRRIVSRFPNDPYALGILAEAELAADHREEAAAAARRWLVAAPKNARAKLLQAQLAIDALGEVQSKDAKAWESARALILEANKLAPNDPMPYESYYDSFVAEGVQPPAGAQNALFRGFELVPQDQGIRYKLAADFEARGMIREAITIIKPIAVQAHDPTGESTGKRNKRERLKRKYRRVGESDDEDTPLKMLKRLEAKLPSSR